LLVAVDSAYATKYAADVELADMLTPGVVATTLALTPVGKIDIVSEAAPSSR